MKMESVNGFEININKISEIFPSCITETRDTETGRIKKIVNFDALKRLLVEDNLDDNDTYEFTWVGKRKAIIDAFKPIRKTLRPCLKESRNWDTTENLYIEGDNLEVLKLLQESYLEKIKLIYIDPPYNTGSDFIYLDDFSMGKEEYQEESGELDYDGNRLFKNNDSNGRFHSDWCSMIYPRLVLARNLLRRDGVIFISIDDNEITNLSNICNEVFGESNYVGTVIWERAFAPKNDAKYFSASHDYILVYAKSLPDFKIGKLPRTEEANARYKNPDNDPRGPWQPDNLTVKTYSAANDYPITTPGGRIVNPSHGSCWRVSQNRFQELLKDNRIYFGSDGNNVPRLKRFLNELQDGMTPTTLWKFSDVGHNQEGRQEVKKLFDGKGYFDGPKPQRLMHRILQIANVHDDDIVLDFFSGSASTAQAVMEYNIEDSEKRKFILVQLAEPCDEKSDAYKDGYKTICDIGKKRIALADEKLKIDYPDKKFDGGYRVLKLDDSNMNEIYYSADRYSQGMIAALESNIKSDRSELDLLFGCLLDWGLPLSLPYSSEKISGVNVHIYNDGDLIACFDENVPEDVVREIAKRQPLRAVFRDSSFSNSPAKINVGEIFKAIAPDTNVKVI